MFCSTLTIDRKTPINHYYNNKIITFPNLRSLRMAKTENIHFKSMVIYKFDNDKISVIQYDKENKTFIANHIDKKAIIKYKEIYFDENRIGEYYRNYDNQEKYFETNLIKYL